MLLAAVRANLTDFVAEDTYLRPRKDDVVPFGARIVNVALAKGPPYPFSLEPGSFGSALCPPAQAANNEMLTTATNARIDDRCMMVP